MDAGSPFAAYLHDETSALVGLLETEARKVLVIVVAVEGGEVAMCRSASDDTSASCVAAMLEGVERQCDRISARLAESKR